MFRILPRTALIDLLKVWALTVVAITALFLVFALLGSMHKGVPVEVILQTLPYLLPLPLPFVLPIACLLASALVLGRLVTDNELVAIRAAGVHLGWILAPVFLWGLLLCALCQGLNHIVTPLCRQGEAQTGNLAAEALRSLPAGTRDFETSFGTETLMFRLYDGRFFHDVTLHYVSKNQDVTLQAARARMHFGADLGEIVLDLEDVRTSIYDEATQTHRHAGVATRVRYPIRPRERSWRHKHFTTPQILRELAGLREITAGRPVPDVGMTTKLLPYQSGTLELDPGTLRGRHFDELTLRWWDAHGTHRYLRMGSAELWRQGREVSLVGHEVRRGTLRPDEREPAEVETLEALTVTSVDPALATGLHMLDQAVMIAYAPDEVRLRTEIQSRLVLALAPLVFLLVGAPLPLLMEQNNRLVPFFISLGLMALTFFAPFILFYKLGHRGTVLPEYGMWVGVAISTALGLMLLKRLLAR